MADPFELFRQVRKRGIEILAASPAGALRRAGGIDERRRQREGLKKKAFAPPKPTAFKPVPPMPKRQTPGLLSSVEQFFAGGGITGRAGLSPTMRQTRRAGRQVKSRWEEFLRGLR